MERALFRDRRGVPSGPRNPLSDFPRVLAAANSAFVRSEMARANLLKLASAFSNMTFDIRRIAIGYFVNYCARGGVRNSCIDLQGSFTVDARSQTPCHRWTAPTRMIE